MFKFKGKQAMARNECYDAGHLYKLKFFMDTGLFKAPIFIQFVLGILGGNLRVGLEDSLFISRGKLASSNAEHVTRIRRIVEDPGCEIATLDEAREILALEGAYRVQF